MSGNGENRSDSYSVHLPFTLAPGRELNISQGGSFDLFGHACKIAGDPDRYEMTISGFGSEQAAASYLQKACAGLIWFGLRGSFGLKFNQAPKSVQLFSEPRPVMPELRDSWAAKGYGDSVDGAFDASYTTIRPDQKRLLMYSGHGGKATVGMPVSALADALSECLGQGRPEAVLGESKLFLACEVYMSSHFESTPTASFLSRITALEILIPDVRASQHVLDTVERFLTEARGLRDGQARRVQDNGQSPEGQEQASALAREYNSLVGSLTRLRNRSIKSRIRQLVLENWQSGSGSEDATEIPRKFPGCTTCVATWCTMGCATRNSFAQDMIASIRSYRKFSFGSSAK